jgi:putative thioredoxin
MHIFGTKQTTTPASQASEWIKDGTDKSFQADVLQTSMQVPVIIDFWAPWCGPCKQLGPVLERAVNAAKGKVRLVKINIDENPAIAGQLRVQSIPAVFAIFQGQPVDGFQGALPQSEVESFVRQLTALADGGKATPDFGPHFEKADLALAENDLAQASQLFAQILQVDETNIRALAGLIRVYVAADQLEEARRLYAMIDPASHSDANVVAAAKAVELAEKAANAPSPKPFLDKLANNPDDHQTRMDLADVLLMRGDFAGAADALLAIITAELEFAEGAARKKLLEVFEAAGPTSPVTRDGRRRLSSILFS